MVNDMVRKIDDITQTQAIQEDAILYFIVFNDCVSFKISE